MVQRRQCHYRIHDFPVSTESKTVRTAIQNTKIVKSKEQQMKQNRTYNCIGFKQIQEMAGYIPSSDCVPKSALKIIPCIQINRMGVLSRF